MSMGRAEVATLARHLACHAEQVCRHYLSNGRREGRTWRVGDADNTPGCSLSVQLDSGRWVDFATGERGDLLDVIARTRRLEGFRDVLDEARRFLSLPDTEERAPRAKRLPGRSGLSETARRLFASARPLRGTCGETYLRHRGIRCARDVSALRFHPRCVYRAHQEAPHETWPALLAAVTDLDGTITGVQRTWLTRDGAGKAPLEAPRRALGRLAGHGVRFGRAEGVMVAGEGIETVLALREVLPLLPMVAALSASNLALLKLPHALRRLYVARDNDRAGHRAAQTLAARGAAAGVEVLVLAPQADDFNTDLCTLGRNTLAVSLCAQLMPDDVAQVCRVQ